MLRIGFQNCRCLTTSCDLFGYISDLDDAELEGIRLWYKFYQGHWFWISVYFRLILYAAEKSVTTTNMIHITDSGPSTKGGGEEPHVLTKRFRVWGCLLNCHSNLRDLIAIKISRSDCFCGDGEASPTAQILSLATPYLSWSPFI